VQPRIEYAKVAPAGDEAMRKLETYGRQSGLESSLLELAKLRASQINGMSNEIRLTPIAWQYTYSSDAKASDSTFSIAGWAGESASEGASSEPLSFPARRSCFSGWRGEEFPRRFGFLSGLRP
jgi:hypothetical protein